ncbi:MAG: MlaD family protein [Solirubrobacteraceae bacterium]
MSRQALRQVQFTVILVALAAVGLLSAGYVLLHERLAPPLQSTYTVNVDLTAANGVVPGLGQPVEVAGVSVGSITGADVQNGRALVTMQIDRSQLPRVYTNASATLAPITPLQDMQLLLNPGDRSAPVLPDNGTIEVGRTASPVPLSQLLSTLDHDTRDWLRSLIVSLGQGTSGQAPNLRKLLLALAPTSQQLGGITSELAARRQSLARLVHNLAIVASAASRDNQLASVVYAGDQTLRAIANQDVPLGQALSQLPGTLSQARTTLADAATFSTLLGPTVSRLTPALKRLPHTLAVLRPFADRLSTTLRTDVRPLVNRAEPVARELGPAVTWLSKLVPNLTSVMQVLQYTVNELAYNPGGSDPGYLFWLDWWAHNGLSVFSIADAHGSLGRASVFVNCQQLDLTGALKSVFQLTLGVARLCP